MRIKLINPNTTAAMTESCRIAAEQVKRPDTEIIATNPSIGPDSSECYVDEYLAIPGVLGEILKGDREEGIDAYIIDCFGDPGLQAAREVTDKPVLGIGQSAMLLARMVAPNFSIISVLDRALKVTDDLVDAYGMRNICKSIRTTGLSVLDFTRDFEKGLAALSKQAELAVKEDKAECVLLGCAGFVDFVQSLSKKLSVPVIDGVLPAVKFAEAMVDMRITTSKCNTWKYPEQKAFKGFEYLPFIFN